MRRKQTCSKCGQSSWRSSSQFSSAVLNVSGVNSGAKDAQWQFFKVAGLLRCFCSCSFSKSHYSTLTAAGFSSANKRHRRDSNPCGQSPRDFESIPPAAGTPCHEMQPYAMCEVTSAMLSIITRQPDRASPRTHLAENPARQSAQHDRHGAETSTL